MTPERARPEGSVDRHAHRRVRGRGELPAVALAAYLVAALAWLALLDRAVPMPGAGMAMDPTAPGAIEAMALAAGLTGVVGYLLAWGVMMVAMMYPSSAGIFQWFADLHGPARSAGALGDVAAFAGAYTLLWALVGLAPLGFDAVASLSALAATWGPRYLGVALLIVGTFQLSPVKRRYLRRCRSPADVAVGPLRPGVPTSARLGWRYGVQDLGACGVPMGLMVVVGSMDVGWMALITAGISLERLSAHGLRWARLTGAVAVAGGGWLVLA
jgi:predicted metal-binding membrane protein